MIETVVNVGRKSRKLLKLVTLKINLPMLYINFGAGAASRLGSGSAKTYAALCGFDSVTQCVIHL
jgi:hypothetical protein